MGVIQKELALQKATGASVVIMHRGKVALIRGFGTGVTPRTSFPVSPELLTALEALRMVENGQLNLDQPVTAYLSGFKVPGGITLRQLLSHTSGLAESVLEPIAAPGQVFSYSPVGYSVVAQVIQQVSGRPFADQLIGDLGLPSTTLATSTAQDMARVLEFLLTGRPAWLPASRLLEMKTAVLGVPPFNEAFGLGLGIKQRRGYQSFGTSYLEVIPSQQLGVLVLTGAPGFSHDAIVEAALDAIKVARPRPAPPVSTANVADYLGLYEWLSPQDGSMDLYRVYQAADGLHLSSSAGDFPFVTLVRDGFTVNGVRTAFLRNADGVVNFLWAMQAAPRLPQPARDVNLPFQGTVPPFDAARAVLQPTSQAFNDVAAAAARSNPALLAFGTANLTESGAFDEIRRCLGPVGSVGIRVALGLDLRNPDHVRRLETLFEIAQEKAVPLLIELTDPQGRTLDVASMATFTGVAAKYPVRVCIARAGGTGLDPAADLTAARNLAEAYRNHPEAWKNAYLELSGTGSQGAPLVEVLRLWGWPRVLLGGGDLREELQLPLRRSERAALLGNDGSGFLGR